ncbi:MAG: hypothetical protein IPG61_01710 [bacterium]|nr:hypothetical protein [bacterium]
MIIILLAVAVPAATVRAQAASPPPGVAVADTGTTLVEHEFHLMPARLRALPLAHGFVEPGSLRLLVDGVAWREGTDFHLRARSGLVVPLRGWRATGADSTAAGAGLALVSASYRFVPVPVASRLDLREVAAPPAPLGPSPGAGGPRGATALREAGDWRDGGLRVTGSKTVQVSSGSRREMTVDQNLRLNINGRLTPEIGVRAFLSDDNLPVVPEGNTEELKDIDKVLVEINGPAWNATLGDLVVQRRGTAFGDVRRKLQGLDVRVRGGATTVDAVAGAPRGSYRTVQLQGQESNQGPYRLAGGEGGANLFLVAGSERVTLDGQPLVRGADRDYVIDYVLGTITFTYRRLVTAESLITVEFEQGEGAYSRTVLGAGVEHEWHGLPGGAAARLRARVLKEADDPARLRTGDLADGDEAALSAAGDDPLLAVAPGASASLPGEGQYDLQVAGTDTIYVFAVDGGDWSVAFHYVGAGLGDYRLDSLTNTGQRVFVYTGAGAGAYRVGRPLALPASHSLATFSLQVGDSAASGIDAEWNASQVDRNLLSGADDDDNGGGAGRLAGRWNAGAVSVGGRSLGKVTVNGTWEGRDARFAPLQLHRTIGDYEAWGLGERARRTGFLDQADRQADGRVTWQAQGTRGRLDLAAAAGSLRHGDDLEADRRSLEAQWGLGAGRGRHEISRAGARDVIDPLDIERRAQHHELAWRLGALQPSVTHDRRQWRDEAGPTARPRDSASRRAARNWPARTAVAPRGGSISGVAWPIRCARGPGDASGTAARRAWPPAPARLPGCAWSAKARGGRWNGPKARQRPRAWRGSTWRGAGIEAPATGRWAIASTTAAPRCSTARSSSSARGRATSTRTATTSARTRALTMSSWPAPTALSPRRPCAVTCAGARASPFSGVRSGTAAGPPRQSPRWKGAVRPTRSAACSSWIRLSSSTTTLPYSATSTSRRRSPSSSTSRASTCAVASAIGRRATASSRPIPRTVLTAAGRQPAAPT